MGLTPPRNGAIRFKGKPAAGNPAYVMAKKGVAYMPDDLRIFPDLTCEENLEIARRLSGRSGYWNRKQVEALFPVLSERSRQMGLNLSGGEKKMLSMGRALMANPKVLLLDEPSMGLAPVLVDDIFDTIRQLHAAGTTILLVTHDNRILDVADRILHLEDGQIQSISSAVASSTSQMLKLLNRHDPEAAHYMSAFSQALTRVALADDNMDDQEREIRQAHEAMKNRYRELLQNTTSP